MTAEIIDLTTRRAESSSHMKTAHDYRSRMDYATFAELLADADRVVDDLEAISGDRLLVTRDEIAFTLRRLHVLIRGAMKHAPDVVAEVP